MSARLGWITSHFWADYGPIANHSSRIQEVTRANNPTPQQRNQTNSAEKWPPLREAFVFLSGGVDLVLYNVLLQGQFRSAPYDVTASDVERVIPHVVVGFVVGIGEVEISYSYTHRGPEISGGKSHGWSSISVGLRY